MPSRKTSETHPIIHCSTNFWLSVNNTPRTVNCILKWSTEWNAWSKTPNQVRDPLQAVILFFFPHVSWWLYVFVYFVFAVSVDQSPSIQRILATNPDLTYSGSDSNGSSVNGICNGGDGTEASLHAIFLELSEKHMAEQLTRLDTVS